MREPRKLFIWVDYKGKVRKLSLSSGADISDLMVAMELPLTSCIAVRDGAPIPSDERLRRGDAILLLDTFSGG